MLITRWILAGGGCLLALAAPLAQAQEAPGTCATEARYPTWDDPTGVPFEKLDAAAAVAACEKELASAPDNPAVMANLGRALLKAGRHDEGNALIRRAADAGNPQAQRSLGLSYAYGRDGIEADPLLGVQWLQKAIDAGYVEAVLAMGGIYHDGAGSQVPRDEAKAVQYYQRGVALGIPVAKYNMAVLYDVGQQIPHDRLRANQLYLEAAEAGDTDAMRALAINLENGAGIARDKAAAASWFRRAADAGDTQSLVNYARNMAEGSGVPRDEAGAIALLREAVAAKEPTAYVQLGVMIEAGRGVPRDRAEGLRLFREGVAAGDAVANYYVGYAYEFADATERDFAKALEFYRAGSDAGDDACQVGLARMYNEGKGVPADPAKALEYLRLAAASDNSSALNEIAYMTERGTGGLNQDPVEAARLLQQAAELGSADAMIRLSKLAAIGKGVPLDMAASAEWERKAAETGSVFGARNYGRKLLTGIGSVSADLGEARTWLEAAYSRGDLDSGPLLVRAMLSDPASGGAPAVASVLRAGAERGEGWAMAGLGYPGEAFESLVTQAESQRWRARMTAAAIPAETRLGAAQALKDGSVARQNLAAAVDLVRLAKGGDPFGAREQEFEILLSLHLPGAALHRYVEFTRTEAWSAASADRREAFTRYFREKMRGQWYLVGDQALEDVMVLAEAGSGEAADQLGDTFVSATNPNRNYARAREWYEKAVQLGEPSAYNGLGYMAEYGLGIPADPKLAAKFYLQGAEAGDAYAKRNIGMFYFEGIGVEKDPAKAYFWIERAAQEGVLSAEREVALLKFAGLGTPVDPEGALVSLRAAVACGDIRSLVTMGQAFLEGAGFARDPQEGLRWMRYAASFTESSEGALAMVRASALGWGMAPDQALTKRWLDEAVLRGDYDAAEWQKACPDAAISCLAAQESFRIKPLMAAPISTRPPLAPPAEREKVLRETYRKTLVNQEGNYLSAEAQGDLQRFYLMNDEGEKALGLALHSLLRLDVDQSRLFGSNDNYFALFGQSCHWATASTLARAAGLDESSALFAKLAVNKLQEARGRISDLDDDLRECFIQAHRDRYRLLAGKFLDLGRFDEAENVLAMLKDFELHGYEGKGGERGRSLAMLPLSTGERALMDRYAALTRRYGELAASSGMAAAENDPATEAGLAALTHDFAALKNFSSAGMAGVAPIAPAAPPRVVAAIDKLGGGHLAALQAVAQPSALYWLISTADGQQTVRIAVDLAEISQLITQYRNAILLEDDEAEPLARQLYDKAFAPVDRVLREKGITELALSLDDVLRYLPFAALHDGDDWLIQRYSFSQFRDAGDLVVRARSDPWRVAGFGLTRKIEGFDALPNVGTELRGIMATSGGTNQGTLRLDEQFDRASLKVAGNRDVGAVHVASHFHLDPARLDKSYLLLGNGDHLGLDAFGTSSGLDLTNTDFLALSACETALPSPSANGAEIDSLAEVAQAAGAPAVLASLWSVSDDSTAQLMIEFYSGKANRGLSKDGALQAAQRKLIADARSGRRPAKWAQPFYWAPFILLGDPR